MSYDDIIAQVGNIRNRFQIFLFFGLTFRYLKVESISFLFLTLKTNYQCDWIKTFTEAGLSFNETCGAFCRNQTEQKCVLRVKNLSNTDEIKCSRWRYEKDLTIISEFDLVCDKMGWVNIIQGSLWIGMVAGIVLGPVADRFGRRITIISANYLDIICSTMMVFANGPWMLMILRFFTGVLTTESKISLINFQELSNVESRVIAGTCWWLMWVFGYCFVALFAYIFPYWRHLQLSLVVIVYFVCLQPLYVPESPRWLLVRNRPAEAQKTLNWLCKMNRVEPVLIKDIRIEKKTDLSFFNIIQNGGVLARILFTIMSWSCVSLVYYGISLNVNFATENPYISTLIMGIAEFPAIPLGYFMSKYLGYRTSLYILVSITSSMIIIIPWIMDLFLLRLILSFIGKVCVTSAYTLVIVFTGELFPTGIRNTGLSFNCLCKLSGTIIPYINDLRSVHFFIPAAIFGLCGIVLIVIIVPFPETKGGSLAQRMSDMPKLKWKIFKQASMAKVSSTDNPMSSINYKENGDVKV